MSFRIKHNSLVAISFFSTLNDKYIGTITTGLTFSVQFTRKQDSITHNVATSDSSPYPDVYNILQLTTLTGATGSNNAQLDQGWYKYEIYTWEDRITKLNMLELGQVYVYDDATKVQNTPDNTETYEETKDKYVYQR